MTEGAAIFVFDTQNPDRLRPSRGVVHEVHPRDGDEDFVRVSGSMALRSEEMFRNGGRTHKPFHRMPLVPEFTMSDPVKVQWPHLGRFVALKLLGGEA